MAAILWGTTGTSQALAPAAASPLAVGGLRLAIGAAALVLLATVRGVLTRDTFSRARGPILVAAVGIATYQLAFFSGVRLAGVAVGTLVGIGSSPIFAGLLAWGVEGRRPGRRWYVATGVALLGCGLLGLPSAQAGLPPVSLPGLALTLVAGAAYAMLSLAGQRMGARVAPDAGMALAFAIGTLLLLPVLLSQNLDWLAEWPAGPVMLHLGVLATAVPYVLYLRALRTVPVATAVTLTLAEPLTAATLGLLLLGERLPATGYAGMACLVLGIALLVLPKAGIMR
jgi:DME family drug/metabolite transporter